MTIPPDQIEARSQSGAWSLSGSFDSAVKPCSGWVAEEACYTDRWATQLTGAPIRIADVSGVVIDHGANAGLPTRDRIRAQVTGGSEQDDAVTIRSAPTDQGYAFETTGRSRRMPVDLNGLKPMRLFPPKDGNKR